MIEEFFKDYKNTFTAIGSIGTMLAVAVALYLARKGEAIRLKGEVSIWHGVIRIGNNSSVKLNITNIGLRPAYMEHPFFAWHIPFYKEKLAVMTRGNPLAIVAGKCELVYLQDEGAFVDELRPFLQKIKWFKKQRIRFLKAYYYTNDGKEYRAKINKSVQKKLNEFIK